MTKTARTALIEIRNPTLKDVPRIYDLVQRVYGNSGYTRGMLQGQVAAFREGQFIVEYEGDLVGYAAGFRIDEKTAMGAHTWAEIT
ncbi:MAG: carbon-nitrogen hydrolase, partial [Brevundimonas sp.]